MRSFTSSVACLLCRVALAATTARPVNLRAMPTRTRTSSSQGRAGRTGSGDSCSTLRGAVLGYSGCYDTEPCNLVLLLVCVLHKLHLFTLCPSVTL